MGRGKLQRMELILMEISIVIYENRENHIQLQYYTTPKGPAMTQTLQVSLQEKLNAM